MGDAQLEASVHRIEPDDSAEIKRILNDTRPDGFVCANDFTAAQLLKTLDSLGVSVPDDIRMAGVDDVKYASLLSVPLTTIHQPCADIGAMAIAAMLERLRSPRMPARDILLNFHVVERESCGTSRRR
jgi:DNA-binding LacI/PurR family transcriptional regulator